MKIKKMLSRKPLWREIIPYFCQGLGHQSEFENKDSMYMHRDFAILETLIELVNHQIDLFNQDPRPME